MSITTHQLLSFTYNRALKAAEKSLTEGLLTTAAPKQDLVPVPAHDYSVHFDNSAALARRLRLAEAPDRALHD